MYLEHKIACYRTEPSLGKHFCTFSSIEILSFPGVGHARGIFQVQSDLFMSIYRVTEIEPDWLQWYNVAEINYDHTKVREHLGAGKFGVVSNGVIQLENGLK